MKRPLLPVMLLCMALSSAVLCATPSQPDGAWGEPVEGVQLHLALAASGPPALPGELPPMELQIRNRGRNTITIRPEKLMYVHVEVDGHWYAETHAIWGAPMPVDIAPGSESSLYRREPKGSLMFGVWDDQGRKFELAPGPHQIRVGLDKSAFVNELGDDRSWLKLASNRIIVDVPAWSASAERDALIARTSAGGFDYLPAAQLLLQKYPDAALPAIEDGVAASTDPDARERYVELAGTLPGDGVTPFLLTQIAPAVELRSRMSAAQALLSRGRDEGLWSLMDTWQHNDPYRGMFPGQAQLLAFLVGSGHPAALDLLGRLPQTTSDIRLAMVTLLMPSYFTVQNGWGRSRESAFTTAASQIDTPDLAGGTAGAAAAERLLGGALEDSASVPVEMRYEGVTYTRPRVCDMAALALSLRWPAKYRFVWSRNVADHDRQIDVIRAAWGEQR